MSNEKRYYWLRLKEDFFTSKRIKKLRKLAGGDTYTIIYLEIQLKAIKNGGILRWTGLEDNFAAEIALDLDEDEDNVKFTLAYLLKYGLAESSDNINFLFPYAVENIGSEGASAKRMRDMRAKLKESSLPPPQIPADTVTLCEQRYGEKEREREIESEIELEIEPEIKFSNDDMNDDEPVAGIIEEFAYRNGMTIDAYTLLHACDQKTRGKISEVTKTLFSKAVGTSPSEMDEAKVFTRIMDGNKVSSAKIYILTCAFYKAADAGHRGQWNYIETILDDMDSKGVKTKDDVAVYFRSRKGEY